MLAFCPPLPCSVLLIKCLLLFTMVVLVIVVRVLLLDHVALTGGQHWKYQPLRPGALSVGYCLEIAQLQEPLRLLRLSSFLDGCPFYGCLAEKRELPTA